MTVSFDSSTLLHNVIMTVVTVIYVKTVTFLCAQLVYYGIVGVKLSRKMIHVLAGTWMLFWPYFSRGDGWSWTLAMAAPLAYAFVLLYKGLYVKDRNDADVKSMSRSGCPRELLAGPLYYLIVMCAVGFGLFMEPRGILTLSALSFGDGLAPYFGETYGHVVSYKSQYQYRTLGRYKTYLGSLVMFVASLLGGLLMYACVLHTVPSFTVVVVHGIASFVAMLAEAFSPSDLDNFAVPLSVYGTLRVLSSVLRIPKHVL